MQRLYLNRTMQVIIIQPRRLQSLYLCRPISISKALGERDDVIEHEAIPILSTKVPILQSTIFCRRTKHSSILVHHSTLQQPIDHIFPKMPMILLSHCLPSQKSVYLYSSCKLLASLLSISQSTQQRRRTC